MFLCCEERSKVQDSCSEEDNKEGNSDILTNSESSQIIHAKEKRLPEVQELSLQLCS